MDRRAIGDLLPFNKKLMRIFGVGMFNRTPDGTYENFSNYRYRLYSGLVIVWGFVFFMLLEIIELKSIKDDLDKVTLQLCFIPSQMLVFAKAISLIYHSGKFTELIHTLEKSSLNLYVSRDHIVGTRKRSIFITKIYLSIVVVCIVNFAAPTIQLLQISPFYTDVDRVKKLLPFNAYTPFEINSKFRILFVLLYQMSTMIYEATLSVTMDSTAASILMHIASQYITVQEMMKNIYKNAIQLLDFRIMHYRYCKIDLEDAFEEWLKNRDAYIRNKNYIGNYTKSEISYSMTLFLKEAIKLYQTTNKCVIDFHHIFRYGLNSQVITSTFVICMTFYQLMATDTDGIVNHQVIAAVMMMLVFMLQLGIFTWNCNRVTCEAEKVAVSAWCGAWYHGDTKFRRDLMMAITYTQRPQVVATFSGLIPLSNKSFVEIFRRAYSAFAVLMNFNK